MQLEIVLSLSTLEVKDLLSLHMLGILELPLPLAFHQNLSDDIFPLRKTHRIRILAEIGFDLGRINLYKLWLFFLYAIDAWLVINSEASITDQL